MGMGDRFYISKLDTTYKGIHTSIYKNIEKMRKCKNINCQRIYFNSLSKAYFLSIKMLGSYNKFYLLESSFNSKYKDFYWIDQIKKSVSPYTSTFDKKFTTIVDSAGGTF